MLNKEKPMERFDRLLTAMVSEKPAKEGQTSNVVHAEGCADIQSPKDSSASVSLTPKCVSPE